MDRLTGKNNTINKPYLEMCDLEMNYRHPSMYSTNCYTGKAVDKLSELEDVLEEFGIESAEELKAQLSKAIVPKFEIGQEVWAVDVLRKDNVDCFIITEIGYLADYGIYYKTNQGINLYEYYFDIFPTQAEAQAKLDEIRRK